MEATESFYYVIGGVITPHPDKKSPYSRPQEFGGKTPDDVLAAQGHYRLHVDDGGPKPDRFHIRVKGVLTVQENPPLVKRVDSWQSWSAQQIRADHESIIEEQRQQASRSTADLRADPGLAGMIDEANAAAEAKLNDLDLTPDNDLPTFDPLLEPATANAVQLGASLTEQGRNILASPMPMTATQRADLETAVASWQNIVDQGVPDAAVDEVPPFARRAIGVISEDFGRARCRRFFDVGWWWIEIEMLVERELGPGATYFVAIYDISAPDDRDDTTTAYRTTAQLTDMGGGRFLADKNAINLPKPNTNFGIKFTLCRDHISLPQFDRVTFAPGELARRYRFRWGGLA